MTTTQLPSRAGQEYTLVAGDYTAVITEQGAALEKLEWQDKEIIVPFNPNEPVAACRGQILIPYPNRIEDGDYEFEGKAYSFPIDEHERHNSIHGLGYRYPWKLESLNTTEAVLSWRTPNLAGYPFDVIVTVTYTLDVKEGLSMKISAYNAGDVNAPWAFAVHPWLANGGNHTTAEEMEEANAQCSLTLPALTHVTVNDRLLPTGTEPVDGTQYDFREHTQVGRREFDDAWTDVQHDANGQATAVFTRPDGVKIELSGDESVTSFQVCNGFGWDVSQKPWGIAVEPQTAYANAFRTGKDLIVIAPSKTAVTTVTYKASK